MIHVELLTKRYINTPVLDGVSFDVQKGEILGFLGPNGAGKTTAMRILSCYMPPTSGTATIDGCDVLKDSLGVRRRVGYLPENVPLYGELRVNEYLKYRARLKGTRRGQLKTQVDRALERCSLGDVRTRIIGQLSKGYKQRVGLADALLGSPKVLILDEPTDGLDPNQIRQVRDLIRKLASDHTVLLSTHILPEVENVCGRVVIINRGRIVAQDSPEKLRSRLQGAMRVFVEVKGPRDIVQGVLSKLGAVRSLEFQEQNGFTQFSLEVESDIREEVYRLGVQYGWVLRELKLERASLEDLFVHITTQEAV